MLLGMNDESLLQQAFYRFDQENSKDPNTITVSGVERARELVFAERLTASVLQLRPDASEALLLASRCQHIGRWQVPRNTQPMGRAGYLKWRAGLKKFHAEKSSQILRQLGYDEVMVAKVKNLNLKKDLLKDPDCQSLEDALCLVFLEHQFDDLIASTEAAKMQRIVKKTWAKMSPDGHREAQKIVYSPAAEKVLTASLSAES